MPAVLLNLGQDIYFFNNGMHSRRLLDLDIILDEFYLRTILWHITQFSIAITNFLLNYCQLGHDPQQESLETSDG